MIEQDQAEADQILAEYVMPDSDIDMGNLYFAATTYRSLLKYERERTKGQVVLSREDAERIKDELNNLISYIRPGTEPHPSGWSPEGWVKMERDYKPALATLDILEAAMKGT